MVQCAIFEQVGACVNNFKDANHPCIFWHRINPSSRYAFLRGVQQTGDLRTEIYLRDQD